jgi:hypothetical protein
MRGKRISFRARGVDYSGVILSYSECGTPDEPNRYIEFTDDKKGYAYGKESFDGPFENVVIEDKPEDKLKSALEDTMTQLRRWRDEKPELWDSIIDVEMMNQWDKNKKVLKEVLRLNPKG